MGPTPQIKHWHVWNNNQLQYQCGSYWTKGLAKSAAMQSAILPVRQCYDQGCTPAGPMGLKEHFNLNFRTGTTHSQKPQHTNPYLP